MSCNAGGTTPKPDPYIQEQHKSFLTDLKIEKDSIVFNNRKALYMRNICNYISRSRSKTVYFILFKGDVNIIQFN